MKRILALVLLWMVISPCIFADDVTFIVKAPLNVAVGDQFRVQFTVNRQGATNFTAPDFRGVKVIYGPSTSSQSSIQHINGKTTESSSITYTYVVQCNYAGTYTIAPASVTAEGRTLKSSSVSIKAWSLSGVKSLMEQGSYLEAAKQLRPIADGGLAEAQKIAAQLFFESKGVTKNDAQGVKYATLAAQQDNEDAVILLANHYWAANPQKAFETLRTYYSRQTDFFSYRNKKAVGKMLAECYLRPYGTEKDEAQGWSLMEANEEPDLLKKNPQYWMYKTKEAGMNSIEDYADHLFAGYWFSKDKDEEDGFFNFAEDSLKKFKDVCDYIASSNNNLATYYERKANGGNAFACAMLADILYDRNEIGRAREYHRRSLQGGSAYALSIQDKINYTPVSFDINVKFDRLVTFVKVEHRYDKTILHGLYRGLTSDSWKQFAQEAFLITNGNSPKYTMTSTSKRIYGIGNSRPVPFTLEFKPIPQDWSSLYYCYNEQIYMTINK